MKGLTDERKYMFALSVEYVNRLLAYLLHPPHHQIANSQQLPVTSESLVLAGYLQRLNTNGTFMNLS